MTIATTFRAFLAVVFLCVLLMGSTQAGRAQNTDNVGIGTAVPDNSALLELNSMSKGLLVPRMTLAERDAIALPSTGLLIYNTTTGSFQYNFGSKATPNWVTVLWFSGNDNGSANQLFWALGGNDSVNANQFLGSINDAAVVFKSKNTTRMVLTPTGEINITGAANVLGSLNLDSTNTPLLLDGQAGARGGVFISSGPALTPRWTTDLVVSDTGLILDANTYINKPLLIRDSTRFLILPKIPLQYGHLLAGDANDLASPVAPGVNGSLLQIVGGFPQWVDPDKTQYWTLNGNSGTDVTSYVGTRDANDLRLATNNTFRITITAGTGEVTINSLAGAGVSNPPLSGEGLVVVDAAGRLFKRESQTLLQLPQYNMYIGDANNVAQPFPPGSDSTFLASMSGIPTWIDAKNLLRDRPWIIGGNTGVGINPILGNMSTSGVVDLDIYAGGQSMLLLNGSIQQIDAKVPFNLSGSSTPLLLNGLAGSAGMVLTSRGAGNTPVYTDSLTLRELTVSNKLTVSGRSEFGDTATFLVLPKIPLQYGFMLSGDANNWATPFAPGVNGSLLQIVAGTPQWVDPDKTEYWTLSGNTGVAPSAFVGTRDANDLRLGTNNTFRLTISGTTGDVTVNSLSGATVAGPIAVNEGFVSADGAGRLVKRDISTILRLPENNFFIGDSNDLASPFPPGADSTFLGIFNGKPIWYNLANVLNTRAWLVGGNVNPPSIILGNLSTSGLTDLDIQAGGSTRLFLQGGSEAVDVRSSLNLDGTNREMRLNGNPGTDGFVFVSFGPGKTPYYTDSLTLRKLRVTDSLIIDGDFDIPLTYAHMFVGDAANKASELAPGINGSLLQIVAGTPQWVDPDKTEYWSLSGNTGVPASAFVGTRDGNDLRFGTNNTFRVSISGATGEITANSLAGAGTNSPITLGEGFVIADNSGRFIKRDIGALLKLPENYIYVGDSNDVAAPFAPGSDSTFLGIFNGTPTWYDLRDVLNTKAWLVGGNTNIPNEILGNLSTTGLTGLDIRAGGTTRLYLQGGSETVDVRSSLNLDGTNREMRLNGNPGTDGFVFVSFGPGKTPYYTDSLSLRKLRVTDSLIIDGDFDIPLTYAHMFVGDAANKASELAPGINGSLLQIVAGTPQWVDPDKTEYWALSGNTAVPASAFVGTRDANDLRLGTNNAFRMSISGASGEVTINNLAGPGLVTPPTLGEGFVVADNAGKLIKRDLNSFLQLPENYIYVGDSNDIARPFAPGADSTFLGIFNGSPTWYDLRGVLNTKAWLVGGNTNIPNEILGNLSTTGLTGLDIRAGGTTRLYLQGGSETVDVRSSLNLDGTNREMRLNGNPGTDGFVFVSFGPGKTPYYTDSLVLRKLRVTDSLIVDGGFDLPLTYAHMYVGDINNKASELAPGINGSLLQIVAGTPQWVDPDKTEYWTLSGNTAVPASAFVGTRDANDLRLGTGNTFRITISGTTGEITATSLSGVPVVTPLAPNDGFVSADAAGRLVKRDLSTILALPQYNLYVGDATNKAVPFAPGADSTFLGIFGGAPTWYSLSTLLNARAWMVGGNPNPPSPILGNMQTTGITDLDIRAGGQTRLFLQGGADVVDVRSSLNLDGTNRELRLNGSPGTDGFVLVSFGPGKTPYYTDSLVLRKLRVTDSLKLPLNYANIYVGDASNNAAQVPPGVDGSLLQVVGGFPTWLDGSLSGFWSLKGNTNIPATAFLGTTDANDLRLNTNNTLRLTVSSAGQVTINDLAGATIPGALTAQEGFVSADATGRLVKRDLSSILALPQYNLYVGDATNTAAPFAPGADSTVLGVLGGAPTWIDISGLLRDKAWIQGGNTNVVSPILGNMQTTGITDVDIRAGGQSRLFLQGGADVVDVRSSLNLDGTNRELRLNGSPGTDGFVLVSFGPGKTPYYTDSLVLRKLRVSDSLKLPLNFGNIYVGDASNTAAMYPPGADSTLLMVVGGTPVWSNFTGLLSGSAWVQGGNTTITSNILGNMRVTGDRDLDIRAGGSTMIFLDVGLNHIRARSGLDLDGTVVPLLLNGSAGTDGFVLVSKGPGLTPYYTDSLVLRKLRVTDSLKLPLNYANIYVGDITNNAAQLPPGINGSLLQISAGEPKWVQPEDAAYWSLTGNAGIAPTAFVGTRDANDLRFATDNTTRVTVAQGTGNVTMTSLAGAPSSAPVGANDGIMVADGAGLLQKKDRSVILGLLGIYAGRYTNATAAPEFNVVVTLPPGATLDPQAAIIVTPEASTSVSATPFIVNGSRTANTFTINFPGGINPGEAINWLVRNP